jgi:hypothetical protein
MQHAWRETSTGRHYMPEHWHVWNNSNIKTGTGCKLNWNISDGLSWHAINGSTGKQTLLISWNNHQLLKKGSSPHRLTECPYIRRTSLLPANISWITDTKHLLCTHSTIYFRETFPAECTWVNTIKSPIHSVQTLTSNWLASSLCHLRTQQRGM